MLSAMIGHSTWCFSLCWMMDDFDDSFFVQMKVVESLEQKAENLLMDLMDCLVA